MLTEAGYSGVVPGNVSRYFGTPQEARSQPIGEVNLAWDSDDPFIFNVGFDPTIVMHDAFYCTSSCLGSGGVFLPTIEYFDACIRSYLTERATVVDVGCGQGEFVEWLRAGGLDACGYDPVLRRSAPYLHRKYWSPGDGRADLLVMRCVLPHVQAPWSFLNAVGTQTPNALVLIEYQRLDFMIEHGLWFQISHDHVNQFRLEDFEARYQVLDAGHFGGAEWQWVLISPASRRAGAASPLPSTLAADFAGLAQARSAFISRAIETPRPLAIWGGAGKGSAVAFALTQVGVNDVVAIDIDPAKHGRFMEGSGVKVISPETALRECAPETLIVVVNPNHVLDVARRLGDSLEIMPATVWKGAT